jgi:endonuclease/exonuclease/phosphatase family metal-dependent hydrolase
VVGKPTHYGARTFTEETYRTRLAWASVALRELDADVIAFQELWSAQALHDLFEVAGLTDAYDLLFIGESWYDIAVAAAVRKPWRVTEKKLHKSFPDDFRLIKRAHGETGSQVDRTDDDIDVKISIFSRTVMELTIECDGIDGVPPVCVLCAHLKSKLATDLDPVEAGITGLKPHRAALGAAISTIRRTAEAAALRFLLTEQMKGNDTPVLVLGDINDGQQSNTANILTEQPRYLVGDSVGGGDVALYTAQTLQEYRDTRDVYYTHVHQEFRESLDHILVSEQFYDNSRKRLWLFDGLAINNDHLNFDNHKLDGTNDHGIIRAVFKHKPIKESV